MNLNSFSVFLSKQRRAALVRFMLVLPSAMMAIHAIANSNLDGPYARQVQQMYVAYYGRPGDPAGVEYWAGRLERVGGNWISDLVNAFGNSAEYIERFGALSDEALIDNLYRQLFNRNAEPVGHSFYIDLLGGTNRSGLNPPRRQSTLAQIALDIANGARNEDLTILDNKLFVSADFTRRIEDNGLSYGPDKINEAAGIIETVDDTDSSVHDALTGVDDYIEAAIEARGLYGFLSISGGSQGFDTFTPDYNRFVISGNAIQSDWVESDGLHGLTFVDYGAGTAFNNILFDSSTTSIQYRCGFAVGDCSGAVVDFNAQTVNFENVQLVGGGP